MEDLGTEDLKQLVNFYRQKASDLEFQLLQTQLKIAKTVAQQQSVPATKTVVDKKTKTD